MKKTTKSHKKKKNPPINSVPNIDITPFGCYYILGKQKSKNNYYFYLPLVNYLVLYSCKLF